MNSYFIRHTDVLAVSHAVISALYREDKVAIHFPGDGDADLRSMNPSDYGISSDRRQIRCFVDLAQQGGYVWVQYYTESTAKAGFVAPNTPIVFRNEKWENPNYQAQMGRCAILKTLQLTKVQIFTPDRLLALRARRPRQGTISPWPSAHEKLAAVVDYNAGQVAQTAANGGKT